MFLDIKNQLDNPTVQSIWSASVFEPSPTKMVQKTTEFRKHDSWQFYGWVENSVVLGVCGFEVHSDHVEILNISVAEKARHRGIGGGMVSALQGKYGMTIKAETDDDAIGFYRKCGFSATAFTKYGMRRWACVKPKGYLDVIFVTESLSVRLLRDEAQDRALLLEWLTDPVGLTTVAWQEGVPWDARKIEEAFFVKITREDITPCIIEQGSGAIGYIQYYPLDEEAYRFTEQITFVALSGGYGIDLAIALPELWGKGIGTQIVKAMSHYLIHTLGAPLVCADPSVDNPRSVGCFRKAGFETIGTVADYDEPEKRDYLMVYRENQAD